MYIIRLKYSNPSECWLALWGGDPGRTLVKESAEVFPSREACEKKIAKTIKNNLFRRYSRECFVVEELNNG